MKLNQFNFATILAWNFTSKEMLQTNNGRKFVSPDNLPEETRKNST